MTTATPTSPAPSRSRAPLSRLTFGGIIRSEWIKLRSLRSTFWCYLLILLLSLGFTALIAAQDLTGVNDPSADSPMATVATVVTIGLSFTSLISAVLGALVITGEYGTGMIKSTFAADPRRLGALFGKALVFGVVTFVVGLVSLILSAVVAAPLLSHSNDITLDWGDGTFWLTLVSGAGYLALVGLVAFALGAIVRVGAGGIAAGIGLIFVAPIVLQLISGLTQAKWAQNVSAFLPSNAGQVMYGYGSQEPSPGNSLVTLDQTQGFLVMLAWAVVTLLIAAVLVKRRDA